MTRNTTNTEREALYNDLRNAAPGDTIIVNGQCHTVEDVPGAVKFERHYSKDEVTISLERDGDTKTLKATDRFKPDLQSEYEFELVTGQQFIGIGVSTTTAHIKEIATNGTVYPVDEVTDDTMIVGVSGAE